MPRSLILALSLLGAAVIALGISVLYLKRQAGNPPQQIQQPIAPPVAQATTQVTVVLANDTNGSLSKSLASISAPQEPANRPRTILRALLAEYQKPGSPHPLDQAANINDVYTAGGNLAVVDVNSAFAARHRSGILVEELTLASMTQTLAANIPGITRMKLLVDGQERPTLAGHADLTQPYDLSFDGGRSQFTR